MFIFFNFVFNRCKGGNKFKGGEQEYRVDRSIMGIAV